MKTVGGLRKLRHRGGPLVDWIVTFTAPGDWRDALKQLDGNFIATRKIGTDIVISFHNPSVKDFMEGFLAKSDADVIDLFHGARFYEQYAALWNGRRGRRYPGVDAASNDYVSVLVANLWGESSRTIRRVDRDGQTVGVSPHPPSLESRAVFVITVLDALKGPHFAELIDSVIASLSALWTDGKGDREISLPSSTCWASVASRRQTRRSSRRASVC